MANEFGKNFTFDIALFAKVWQRLPFPVLLERQLRQNTGGGSYAQAPPPQGVPKFMPVKLDGVNLNIPPLVTIAGQKNIVKTAVAGRDFTVKEIISANDWVVNIKGFATNAEVYKWGNEDFTLEMKAKKFPEQNLIELINLYRKNASVKFDFPFSGYFGFDRIVIESISFPDFEGLEDCFPFEIQAISDIPLEVSLKSKDILGIRNTDLNTLQNNNAT